MTEKVIVLLKRLGKKNRDLPKGYCKLFLELSLNTPISALLTAYTSKRQIYRSFWEYLKMETNIFNDAKMVYDFLNNFPVIIDAIKDIIEEENTNNKSQSEFLPPDVSEILKEIIRLRHSFDKLSRSSAAPRKTPHTDFIPPFADVFPDYDIHTMDNDYKADLKKDKDDD